MKNTWKRIFIILLVGSLTIIILGPILIRLQLIKTILLLWLYPIKNHLDSYIALLGAIIGSALTISGAMWQIEYNLNRSRVEKEKQNLQHILVELNFNKDKIELIKSYFEINRIKKIIFYRNDAYEYWIMQDNSTHKVYTKNNNGIIDLTMEVSKRFLIKEVSLYSDISAIEELYNKFNIINIANGFDHSFAIEVFEEFTSIKENLETYLKNNA